MKNVRQRVSPLSEAAKIQMSKMNTKGSKGKKTLTFEGMDTMVRLSLHSTEQQYTGAGQPLLFVLDIYMEVCAQIYYVPSCCLACEKKPSVRYPSIAGHYPRLGVGSVPAQPVPSLRRLIGQRTSGTSFHCLVPGT